MFDLVSSPILLCFFTIKNNNAYNLFDIMHEPGNAMLDDWSLLCVISFSFVRISVLNCILQSHL
ncbi:hypothetical protein Lal_00010802 [Lupinus albus]|nr:hypothetical protein Lal_00010802 [Lupinus albus]